MNELNSPARMPFFVYGTLMPGQPNHDLWSGEIVELKNASFLNGRLYDMGPYPMLVEGNGYSVKGMLVSIRDDSYSTILNHLDVLEGYDPERSSDGDYRRVKRKIKLDDELSMFGWVYLGRESALAAATLIESGDWATHTLTRHLEITSWWSNQRFGKST